jgi:hypothetical protein
MRVEHAAAACKARESIGGAESINHLADETEAVPRRCRLRINVGSEVWQAAL